jgi:uncharacterized protein
MATATKEKDRETKMSPTPASVVWFEIPADDVERARKFYSGLFGWKIEKFSGAAVDDYWHIDTGGPDASPDGGLMKRMHPRQPITNYVLVRSVDEAAQKVERLGGKIIKPKTEVPDMGRFVICRDTEDNEFALWETTMDSK